MSADIITLDFVVGVVKNLGFGIIQGFIFGLVDGLLLRKARPLCRNQFPYLPRRPAVPRSRPLLGDRNGKGNVKVITNCFQKVSCKYSGFVESNCAEYYLDQSIFQ